MQTTDHIPRTPFIPLREMAGTRGPRDGKAGWLPYRWNVANYHKLASAGIVDEDARIELIDGELIEMSPIGSMHVGKLERMRRLIEQAVGDSALVFTQNPVVLGTHSEPKPDIAVLKPRADFYESAHPRPVDILLLVELAETSGRYDRKVKIPLYARHGIPEAWLLDLRKMRLEVYRDCRDGKYHRVDSYRHGKLSAEHAEGLTIDLDALLSRH